MTSAEQVSYSVDGVRQTVEFTDELRAATDALVAGGDVEAFLAALTAAPSTDQDVQPELFVLGVSVLDGPSLLGGQSDAPPPSKRPPPAPVSPQGGD